MLYSKANSLEGRPGAQLNAPLNKNVAQKAADENNGAKTDVNTAQGIVDKPELKFIFPEQKQAMQKLQKEEVIKIEAKEADRVEFYIRKPESLTPVYLGAGIEAGGNVWTLPFNSESIPNGNYYLKVEITGQDEKYEGKEILIEIKNEQEKEIAKQEAIKKIIEEKNEKIALQEKEIKENKKETTEIVLEIAKVFIVEIPKIISGQEPTKETIAQNYKKIENEKIVNKIEEFVNKNQEEIIKEIDLKEKKNEKERIENAINLLQKEHKEISKNKPKIPFLEAFSFVKGDKEKNIKEKEDALMATNETIRLDSEELSGIRTGKEQIKKQIKDTLDKAAESVIETAGTVIKENPATKNIVQEKLQDTQNKVEEQLEKLEKIVLEKETAKQEMKIVAAKDSDNDNISDEEEIKIGTDPVNADSDGDGYLDGVEKEGGFDPLNSSPADRIIYETPEKSKAPISENYQIKKVEMIDLSPKEKRIKIEGKGTPNSFVTIYLYSEPLILITKVDAEGNFVYVLDKPLTEGVHRVYVAITNNEGKIKKRSEVFNFLKTPVAVAAIVPPVFPEEVASPAERLYNVYTFLIASIIVVSLISSLVIIDILNRRKRNV
jgi:hypothetical protein